MILVHGPAEPESSWLDAWVGTSGGGGGQYGAEPESSWARGSSALAFSSAQATVGAEERASACIVASVAWTALLLTSAWLVSVNCSWVLVLNFRLTSATVLPGTG